MTDPDTAIELALEDLLLAAKIKGTWLRFPQRFTAKPDIGARVGVACEYLDSLGVPFVIQNEALNYVNNVDQQPVWESLFKKQFNAIACNIVSTFRTNAVEVTS